MNLNKIIKIYYDPESFILITPPLPRNTPRLYSVIKT